jgi:hypothetical protein
MDNNMITANGTTYNMAYRSQLQSHAAVVTGGEYEKSNSIITIYPDPSIPSRFSIRG